MLALPLTENLGMACRRMLPSCAARQRRMCLAAGACLCLLLLSVLALTAPWWGTWLLWQPSRTSYVSDSPGAPLPPAA